MSQRGTVVLTGTVGTEEVANAAREHDHADGARHEAFGYKLVHGRRRVGFEALDEQAPADHDDDDNVEGVGEREAHE